MSPDAVWISQQWRLLLDALEEPPTAGCYNNPNVVSAEQAGRLSVPDAVLGRVLETSPATDRERTAIRAAEFLADHLRHDEVANQCHNLSLELFMMFDQLGVPSVPVWGTLWAETRDGIPQFVLTPYIEREADIHRPGHSWIVTPELPVIDVALKHQEWVEGNYEFHRGSIPAVVVGDRRTLDVRPDRRWLTPPGVDPLPNDMFETDALKYFSSLGWSEVVMGDLILRYIPNAVALPDVGDDLHRAPPLIAGETPHRFFRRRLSRALRNS